MLRRQLHAIIVAPGLLCLAGPALAWVYPEHRDIAVLAVEKLDAERRADFDRLWAEARTGHEGTPVRPGCGFRPGRRSGMHRLGRDVGDRRRPFLFERGRCSTR